MNNPTFCNKLTCQGIPKLRIFIIAVDHIEVLSAYTVQNTNKHKNQTNKVVLNIFAGCFFNVFNNSLSSFDIYSKKIIIYLNFVKLMTEQQSGLFFCFRFEQCSLAKRGTKNSVSIV